MKTKKTLSDLGDEQLSDVLIASVISYNVYLEENALKNKNHFLEKMIREVDKYSFNPSDIKNVEKTAIEAKSFMSKFLFDNMMDSYDLTGRLMDMYVIKYPTLDPADLWENSKEDSKTLIYRELLKKLKDTLKYDEKEMQNFLNVVNKSSGIVFDKKILLEKDEVPSVNVKEIKAALFALEFSKSLVPVTAKELGRNSSDYYIADDKRRNVVLINNGIFTVGKNEAHDSFQTNEEFPACFTAFYQKENGKDILHIGFRGTEPKAQEVIKYALNDYMNMERHYALMEPIISEIIQKAQVGRDAINPLKVKISGHSLGAAMVEKFLEKNKDTESVKFSGVAIASPGAELKVSTLINLTEKTEFLKYPISILSNTVVGLTSLALRKVEDGLNGLSKIKGLSFLKIGGSALEAVFKYKEDDPRLINVNHEKDLVPRIGSLAYKTQKTEITLSDVNQDEGAMTHHKSYNYYGEIAKEITNRPKMYKDFKSLFFVERAVEDSTIRQGISDGKVLSLELSQISENIKKLQEKYPRKQPILPIPEEITIPKKMGVR